MALADIAAKNAWVNELLLGPKGNVEVAAALAEVDVETSEASVRRFRKKVGWEPPITAVAAPEAVEESPESLVEALESEIARLEADNKRLFSMAAKYKAQGEAYIQAVYKAARDASKSVGHYETGPVPAPARDERSNKAEGALWHLTDWQGGKKTETYDSVVMKERIEQFVEKAFEITQIMRADHPVREGLLLFTGDMVEGVTIFPGQVWELDGTLFEQMFRVSSLMEWTIKQALKIYDTVEVVCEWGNHGRLGKKGDGIKPSDNVDRMVYQIVKERLTGEDRIRNFQVTGDWYQHFTWGNYKAVAIHGDEIKSFGGNLPAYGILRKSNAWASGVLPAFKDLYIGHYHQSMQLQLANGGSVFMTGSPESDNIYAQEFVAAQGDPSQRINFVDLEKGRVTYETRIWLD